MYIAQNIKYLRELNKMQGKELAAALGVAQSSISHYESGRMNPSFDLVEKMCDLFHVDAHQLLMVDLSSHPGSIIEEQEETYQKKEDSILWDYRSLVKKVEELEEESKLFKQFISSLKTDNP